MEGYRSLTNNRKNIFSIHFLYFKKILKSKCGSYFEMWALMRNLKFFLFGLIVDLS